MRIWIAIGCVFACLFVARAGHAEPIRILLAASHARGGEGEVPLLHATEDADHVRDALTALGGVAPTNALRIVDPTRAGVEQALDRAREIAAKHAPSEVSFVFYFSGHGDRERIHLGAESIAMTDLMDRVRSIPAALRVLVTDACRNEPTRMKGFQTEPAFALTQQGSAADGVVWLSASEAGEAAQESDELRGAIFTYFWVNGLRGAADADGDGRVTITESYDFAYSQTLMRSARGSGVLQHPTAVFALREVAPVVLTQTFGTATRIAFPEAADTRYLVYARGSRAVLGEIWSRPDRSVALAVPPGRYIVQRVGGGGPAAAEIAIAAGQERVLTSSDFRAVPQEQLARKGGDIVVRPNEVALDLGGATSRIVDGAGTLGLRYTRVFDDWAIGIGPRTALGIQRTSVSNVRIVSLEVDATIERRWRSTSGAALSIGAGVAAESLWQRVERTDAARVAAGGYATSASYRAIAIGPVVVARGRLPIGTAYFVEAAIDGGMLVADFDGTAGALWTIGAGLGAGISF